MLWFELQYQPKPLRYMVPLEVSAIVKNVRPWYPKFIVMTFCFLVAMRAIFTAPWGVNAYCSVSCFAVRFRGNRLWWYSLLTCLHSVSAAVPQKPRVQPGQRSQIGVRKIVDELRLGWDIYFRVIVCMHGLSEPGAKYLHHRFVPHDIHLEHTYDECVQWNSDVPATPSISKNNVNSLIK